MARSVPISAMTPEFSLFDVLFRSKEFDPPNGTTTIVAVRVAASPVVERVRACWNTILVDAPSSHAEGELAVVMMQSRATSIATRPSPRRTTTGSGGTMTL